MALLSKAELSDFLTTFYTVVERVGGDDFIVDRIRADRDGMTCPPSWLHVICLSHMFQTYRRFFVANQNRRNNFSFVDCPLTDHEKGAFRALQESGEDLYEKLPQLLRDGYSVKTSFNNMRKSFCCTLLAPDGSKNANKGLSAFAGNIFDAMQLVIFKHFHVLEGDWSKSLTPSDDDQLG